MFKKSQNFQPGCFHQNLDKWTIVTIDIVNLSTAELEAEEKAEELAPLPPRTLSALPKKGRRSAGSVSARSQDSGHMSGKGDSDDEQNSKSGKFKKCKVTFESEINDLSSMRDDSLLIDKYLGARTIR